MNVFNFVFDDTIQSMVGVLALGLTSGLILFFIRFLLFHWIERKDA